MKGGLGQMPLTLWVLSAAVILYLYIRRAHHGIDLHPGEAVTVKPRAPSVYLPVLPPVPGVPIPTIERYPTQPGESGGVLR